MMFPDAENIQARLVGEGNSLDEMADAVRRAHRPAAAIVRHCRRETVHADLHRPGGRRRDRLAVSRLTSLIRFQ